MPERICHRNENLPSSICIPATHSFFFFFYLKERIMKSHQVSIGPCVSLLHEVRENLWFHRTFRLYHGHLAAVYPGRLSHLVVVAGVPLNLSLLFATWEDSFSTWANTSSTKPSGPKSQTNETYKGRFFNLSAALSSLVPVVRRCISKGWRELW